MLQKIIDILKKNDIENWIVTEDVSHTAELYFIKKQLDMPRIKDLTSYKAEVYRDFEDGGRKMRGSSTALIGSGMTDEEIDSRIKGAYLAAGFVKNPWFELADPVQSEKVLPETNLAEMTAEEAAKKLAEAMFAEDSSEDAFINSAEIFAVKGSRHIVGADGRDVSYEYCRIDGEMVGQCVTPVDVEQHRQFDYDRLDTGAMAARVRDLLEDVRARARASEPPQSGSYDIILKGENVAEILSYYASRSSAAMTVPGYSTWKTGTVVQGAGEGEKLDLSLASSVPFSDEGIPMPERALVKNGELKLIHGDTRYCRYAGTEPTGNYRKIICGNGTKPLAQMRGEGVLEPVSFSDFQMDEFDGHFKGEIRLALLHHADGSVEELTGGSINGSLPDIQDRLTFSEERYEDMSYAGPLAVYLPGVAVAGR